MIIALKKETDPVAASCIARIASAKVKVGKACLFVYITLFTDNTLHFETSCHYGTDGKHDRVRHYYGPAKDIKTGVIVGDKDVSFHVQKTRAFVTIANA